jgi:hypothetical protein
MQTKRRGNIEVRNEKGFMRVYWIGDNLLNARKGIQESYKSVEFDLSLLGTEDKNNDMSESSEAFSNHIPESSNDRTQDDDAPMVVSTDVLPENQPDPALVEVVDETTTKDDSTDVQKANELPDTRVVVDKPQEA